MKQEDLYTSEGWINTEMVFNDPATFIIMIGGRGIGKTYGILKEIVQRKIQFVYMRRTQQQIDAIKTPELSPFRALNINIGCNILAAPIGKNIAGFYNAGEDDKPSGAPIGIGVALSTFSTIRGISSQAPLLMFDEFIPERHERPIKEEGTAFLNAIETLNRNNELLGKAPIKVIMLSNSNDLSSPLLDVLGLSEIIDNMIRKRKYYKSVYNGDLSIYRYIDSPISTKKKDTVLYRVAHNKDFVDMALSNEFSAANYENVKAEQIEQYLPFVSIGEITVYKHKAKPQYYIVSGIKSSERYQLLPNSIKTFKARYSVIWEAYIQGRVYYASAPVKIQFERIWNK